MSISKSCFVYRFTRRPGNPHRTLEYITEELNRGLTFSISRSRERVVSIQGERQEWVSYEIDGDIFRLFVDDSYFSHDCIIEQVLTSFWANLLDFCKLELCDLKLNDTIRERLLRTTRNNHITLRKPGPYFGIALKPSNALTLREKITIATEFVKTGGSFIKEDETYLVDQKIILNESRKIQEAIGNVSADSYYVPNITPYVLEDDFIGELASSGISVVMVNFLIAGLPTMKKVREKYRNLLFWGHRVGYETIKSNIAMRVVALLSTYCGINLVHVGTPLLGRDESVNRTLNVVEGIKYVSKDVLPVFTKTSAEIVPDLRRLFSDNIVIMACGSLRKRGALNYQKMGNWLRMGSL